MVQNIPKPLVNKKWERRKDSYNFACLSIVLSYNLCSKKFILNVGDAGLISL